MFFFFSSRRRHTRFDCDWSSDVCSSDLTLSTCSARRRTSCRSRKTRSPSAPRCYGNSSGSKTRQRRSRLAPQGWTQRSEERRGGEEGRSRWAPDHLKKKKEEEGREVRMT